MLCCFTTNVATLQHAENAWLATAHNIVAILASILPVYYDLSCTVAMMTPGTLQHL